MRVVLLRYQTQAKIIIKKLQIYSLCEYRCKHYRQCLADKTQQYIKSIVHRDQVGFIQD